ncbi:MAG: hypothetical protein ACUVWN_12060 [bacterium]
MATTRAELRIKVRERARAGSNVSDNTINDYLNKAAKQFQADTKLLTRKISFNVRPRFYMHTNEAFNLTMHIADDGYLVNAKDVALSTAKEDVSGSELASALQSVIRGTEIGATRTNVSFDENSRQFTIDASNETSTIDKIEIKYPANTEYYDASYKLFGNAQSASGSKFIGDPAPFCTSEYRLPADFLEIEEVMYENHPLAPEIFRGRSNSSGTPKNFSIYTRYNSSNITEAYQYMFVTPQPITIGNRFDVVYNPEASIIPNGSAYDSYTYDFSSQWDEALIYYSCYLYKLDEDEYQSALMFRGMYETEVEKAINQKSMRVGGAFDMMDRGRRGL